MNWKANKAAIMLFVALGEICQLHDKLHLVHTRIVDAGKIEACVILPMGEWPPDKICEDSRVTDFISNHATVQKYECLAEFLVNSGYMDMELPYLLAVRDYARAGRYAEGILCEMTVQVREEFANWLRGFMFYCRPEFRVALDFEAGPRSLLQLRSRFDSRLCYLDPLEFSPTASRIDSMEEAREVMVMHFSQIRPFAVRYLGQDGLSFLRRQEEIIERATAGGKHA